MPTIAVEGGFPLHGEVGISGAKNAALPLMCAAILADASLVLENIPHLTDVTTMAQILAQMGAEITLHENATIEINPRTIERFVAPYALVKAMRASILALGPLVARFGEAVVSLPGGCAIGSRPVDLHLKGLAQMGASIELKHGYVHAQAKRLKGARIVMDVVSVTGTENLMMAAALAEGTTIIENAAREPEVTDLAACLSAMGAKVAGAGTSTLAIDGVERLKGVVHRVIPDRIETGTYLVAGAICGGEISLRHACPEHLDAVTEKLIEAGAEVEAQGERISLRSEPKALRAVSLTTSPYPGFPTDMQAQLMVLNAAAQGVGTITETIFENRFMHAEELKRLGADIEVRGTTAVVRGGRPLLGARVVASDLRASASLVLAGLVAEGRTIVEKVGYIDRGYEALEAKLACLGARVRRLPDPKP